MAKAKHKGEPPRFEVRRGKLVAAILTMLEEIAAWRQSASRKEILHALFVADAAHLASVGQPITFDNYLAAENGPVGEEAARVLDDQFDWRPLRRKGPPWTVEHSRRGASFLLADASPNRRQLSAAETKELRHAIRLIKIGRCTLSSKATTGHPAWRAARHRCRRTDLVAMDWRRFKVADGEGPSAVGSHPSPSA